MKRKMDELDRLNRVGCPDYQLVSFDRDRLIIAGSTDFSYYHLVEAEFEDVAFISCPTTFSHAKFRLGTVEERTAARRFVEIEAEDRLFAIDAESTGSSEPQVFFILARNIKVDESTVYYYERENLRPGERIAAWVDKRR